MMRKLGRRLSGPRGSNAAAAGSIVSGGTAPAVPPARGNGARGGCACSLEESSPGYLWLFDVAHMLPGSLMEASTLVGGMSLVMGPTGQ